MIASTVKQVYDDKVALEEMPLKTLCHTSLAETFLLTKVDGIAECHT